MRSRTGFGDYKRSAKTVPQCDVTPQPREGDTPYKPHLTENIELHPKMHTDTVSSSANACMGCFFKLERMNSDKLSESFRLLQYEFSTCHFDSYQME